jgi:ATP-dependent RNA helicase DBP3
MQKSKVTKRKRQPVEETPILTVDQLKEAYKAAKSQWQATSSDSDKEAYKAAKVQWRAAVAAATEPAANAIEETPAAVSHTTKKSKSSTTPQTKEKKSIKKADDAAIVLEIPLMSAKDADAWRVEEKMSVEGPDAMSFAPLTSFSTANAVFASVCGQEITETLFKSCAGFKQPTPIQAQSWAIAIKGRDVIAIAETGSGKTLAYILPSLARILHKQEQKEGSFIKKREKKERTAYPRLVVLAPTRELAMQIQDVSQKAGAAFGLRSVVVYGGVPTQKRELRESGGADVVVATTGRLLDLLSDDDKDKGALRMDRVEQLVLDEADRMLDMGFEEDVKKIIAKCPGTDQRHTLFYSATWPEPIRKLASSLLSQDAVRVTIGENDGELVVNHRVSQVVEVVEGREKDGRLLALLQQYHKDRTNRVLVFVLYKKEAERVESLLNRRGWQCVGIHGDKSQGNRTQALAGFKDGTTPLLIATDVAARGLDIPNVSHVINYTFPLTIEDYIHRIGRTGRAGKTGISHTLFTKEDKAKTGALVNVLKEANQPVPESLMQFGCFTKKKEHKMYGAHFKDVDMNKKSTKVKLDD